MSLTIDFLDKSRQLQRKYPSGDSTIDLEDLFQRVVDTKLLKVEELLTAPAFKILFKYWYHNFNGDVESIMGACLKLDYCALLLKEFSTESPRNIKKKYKDFVKKNRHYIEAYEHLMKASEKLDVPLSMLTWQSDFPASFNKSLIRVSLPRIPTIEKMLEAARLDTEFKSLLSGTTSNRSTSATGAIRYLWKNMSIDPQHIIDGHPLLGNRWKLIESLLDCLGDFVIDQNTVRLTISRNPPTPTDTKYEIIFRSYEEHYRVFTE